MFGDKLRYRRTNQRFGEKLGYLWFDHSSFILGQLLRPDCTRLKSNKIIHFSLQSSCQSIHTFKSRFLFADKLFVEQITNISQFFEQLLNND